MKAKLYLLLSLIFLSVLSGSLYYNTVLVDTQSYVLSVYYMQGKELNDDDTERVLESYAFKRPIEIAVVALLEPLLGVRHAFSFINMILLIMSTLLTYVFFLKLFADNEKKQVIAYCAAVLYATSLPVILYATRVLVDVAGYVTLLLGLLVIEWILGKKEEKIYWENHLLVSLLLGCFLLVRDTAVILYPYYFLRILLRKKRSWKELPGFLLSFWPFIFTIVPQLLFMFLFDVGFLLAGKGAAITAGKYSLLGWLKFFIVHIAAFHVAYLFAWIGLKHEKEKRRKVFYWTYSVCALVYLVGIQLVALTSPRFSMVLFPVILGAGAYGILLCAEHWKEKKYFFGIFSPVYVLLLLLAFYTVVSLILALLYPGNTLIPEDAGGVAVLQAVLDQFQNRVGGLFQ